MLPIGAGGTTGPSDAVWQIGIRAGWEMFGCSEASSKGTRSHGQKYCKITPKAVTGFVDTVLTWLSVSRASELKGQ